MAHNVSIILRNVPAIMDKRWPTPRVRDNTRAENKAWDNGRNHNPPQNSRIIATMRAIIIATTTVKSIIIKAFILEFFPLSRSLVLGNRTFHFDCGINLSHCSIGIVEWVGNYDCACCLGTYSSARIVQMQCTTRGLLHVHIYCRKGKEPPNLEADI